MASIRRRDQRWQVQIRRKGTPTLTRSFLSRSDAERWARLKETEIDKRGALPDTKKLRSVTLADLVVRYLVEVTPAKRSADREKYLFKAFLRDPASTVSLDRLEIRQLALHRDFRLKSMSSGSVLRELAALRRVVEVARRDWGIPLSGNPFDDIQMPSAAKPRTRRVAPEELDRLLAALTKTVNPVLRVALLFALETGMRRGEILNARWADLDRKRRVLTIPITKNGYPRIIPLSVRAVEILEPTQGLDDERIFPTSQNALRLSWERLRRRAGVNDLRWHDLRHEAISRFFEMGLNVPEVALISGHRDPRMLFRYTHPRAEQIALKIAGVEQLA